jgi:hypothetical protein
MTQNFLREALGGGRILETTPDTERSKVVYLENERHVRLMVGRPRIRGGVKKIDQSDFRNNFGWFSCSSGGGRWPKSTVSGALWHASQAVPYANVPGTGNQFGENVGHSAAERRTLP